MSELAHMRKLYNDIIYFVQNHVKPVTVTTTPTNNSYPSPPLVTAVNSMPKKPEKYNGAKEARREKDDYIVSLGNSEEHSNLVAESLRSRVENWLNLFQHVLHPNETTNYYFKLESLISRGCYYDDEVARAWIEHESFEEDFAATKPTPASEAAIEALERLVAGGDQEVDSTTCAICLEEGSMMMSVKLPCKHVFHEGCIVKWLHKSNDCLLCRYKFPVANMDQQVAFGTS
ncbi:E3 ubiquitin-protein ligase CIP8-like [Beta vulgaris subsp. vulgaris]|uniref:E3 ubiquitin-protein ligase CIP8-like n=1 Tax=Beta vulgaris subsp. vulgaris TaxID=3555 RepID=UPI002036D22B|nr:E3 ubiquitin-protein ligase CIP8-like [Beta vulgaris subsp. vulgaris]